MAQRTPPAADGKGEAAAAGESPLDGWLRRALRCCPHAPFATAVRQGNVEQALACVEALAEFVQGNLSQGNAKVQLEPKTTETLTSSMVVLTLILTRY